MKDLVGSIKHFSNKKILVLGDLLLDVFSYGEILRLNPDNKAAHLVNMPKKNDYILGGAANVANNLASLGSNVYLIGLVGKDQNSKIISSLCEKVKINFMPFYGKNPTIVKHRIYSDNKLIVRLDYGETSIRKISSENKSIIINKLESLLNQESFEGVVLSDYNKSLFVHGFTELLIDLFNKNKIKIFADPKPANIKQFRNSYAISPNLKEAKEITGINYSDKKSLERMAINLTKSFGSERVIITCGKEGVFGYNKFSNSWFFIESKTKDVADQTGAGDTFISAYALADLSNFDFNFALDIASHAAAVAVGKLGTSTVTQKELISSLKEQ